MKKVQKVLLGDEVPPHHSEPLNPDEPKDKDKIWTWSTNDLAFNMLMLAVDDEIRFEAVGSACTDQLPDGDAALAWKKLESIYARQSTTKKDALKSEFFGTKLKTATSDPDSWFTKL